MLTQSSRNGLLSDGTSLDELMTLDGPRSISARVLSDSELFELELERIFDRSWMFVAHESEIPTPGSFVTRQLGSDPVIVSRDHDGEIHVLLNVCTHRGTQVCAADRGCTELFRCPYHGWSYTPSGDLVGILAEKLLFEDGIDKASMGLQQARVDTYHDLIFATWGCEQSLGEFLGPLTFHLDFVFGGSDNGTEVLGPPQRWVIDANWKLLADNFSTDSNHTVMTHRSIIDLGLVQNFEEYNATNVVMLTDPDLGHSISAFKSPLATLPREEAMAALCVFVGLQPGSEAEIERHFSAEQITSAMSVFPGVGSFFPNFGWLKGLFVTQPDRGPDPFFSIRVFLPRSPTKTEMWSWSVVYKDTPAAVRNIAREATVRTFGTSGIIEQDDGEIWGRIQRAVSGVRGRQRRLHYFSHRAEASWWDQAGDAYEGYPTEDNQWNFWRRWRRMLEAP
jgi:phenylpropionate dioxygenase-like ring-hydroxylating dioxygenase large terminal subunit